MAGKTVPPSTGQVVEGGTVLTVGDDEHQGDRLQTSHLGAMGGESPISGCRSLSLSTVPNNEDQTLCNKEPCREESRKHGSLTLLPVCAEWFAAER